MGFIDSTISEKNGNDGGCNYGPNRTSYPPSDGGKYAYDSPSYIMFGGGIGSSGGYTYSPTRGRLHVERYMEVKFVDYDDSVLKDT